MRVQRVSVPTQRKLPVHLVHFMPLIATDATDATNGNRLHRPTRAHVDILYLYILELHTCARDNRMPATTETTETPQCNNSSAWIDR
jgi:hypothetical protein